MAGVLSARLTITPVRPRGVPGAPFGELVAGGAIVAHDVPGRSALGTEGGPGAGVGAIVVAQLRRYRDAQPER